MSQEGFIVDTHLLRELGDLLVGRDSTAILELVKNGYDADATRVTISAHGLNTPDDAVLSVEDNGNGMSAMRFRSAFLRIAGRDKEGTDRVSPHFSRAYTGQKGIGRLASQKLAKTLEVQSVPDPQLAEAGAVGVEAQLDWDAIDGQDNIQDLREGLSVIEVPLLEGVPSGTVLTMRVLKREWTQAEIASFVNELQSAQPPSLVLGSTSEELAIVGKSLLGSPTVRNTAKEDPGFEIELSGELEPGDDFWAKAADRFEWCIEIDVSQGKARYQISPTTAYSREEPLARTYSFEADADADLKFQSRFFVMPGASNRRGPLKGFVRATSGIRVYSEGFRILPYAEYGDDWLGIDRDYRSGPRFYSIDVDEAASDDLETDKSEGLNALPSNAYFGAVFLTVEGTPGLESLINREGFVPGKTFSLIQGIVQDGVRLSVRVRRSLHRQNSAREALEQFKQAKQLGDGPGRSVPAFERAFDQSERESYDLMAPQRINVEQEEALAGAAEAMKSLEQGLSDADPGRIAESSKALAVGFAAASDALQTVRSYQPELRILAGVGLQLSAFVHDINGMLSLVGSVRELLRGLVSSTTDSKQRSTLQVTLRAADELAHVLARQSSYLTDVLSVDPRRRRSRVKVLDRVESVLRFLGRPIAEKEIFVRVNVPADLKTGPMFPAELTIILTNLLTNAVKNAPKGGAICIDGADKDGAAEILISNDGAAVDLENAERWFLPFFGRTTRTEVLSPCAGETNLTSPR